MNDHRFDPSSETCVGCGRLRHEIEDETRGKGPEGCSAFYASFRKVDLIITPDEKLVLYPKGGGGGFRVEFPYDEMFWLRDTIDDGIAELRRGGRSRRLAP